MPTLFAHLSSQIYIYIYKTTKWRRTDLNSQNNIPVYNLPLRHDRNNLGELGYTHDDIQTKPKTLFGTNL